MRSQEPQGWIRERLGARPIRSDVSHIHERIDWRLQAAHRVDWAASFHCGRCRGLMYRIELRDWGGSRGQDGCGALQCIACGDIIDPVIVKNRRYSGQAPMVHRRARNGRPRVAMAL